MGEIDVSAIDVKQNNLGVFTWIQANLDDSPAYLGTISPASITGLTKSLGGVNPIYAKDPATRQIKIVDRTRAAPDLGETTVEEYWHRAAINYLERLADLQCDAAWFIKIDACGRLDDFYTWSSALLVEGIQLTELDYGALMSFDADELIKITGTLPYLQVNRILPIAFSLKAEDTILAEVVGLVSADAVSCGYCSPYSNGLQKWYAITKANAGSPGLSGKFVFTEDNWNSETALDITGLGGQSPSALVAAGAYFVIVSEQNGAHFVIRKNNLIAGAFTRVSSGYQVGGSPSAIFAKSPNEVCICGLGGYIYRTSNVLTGVTVVHDGSETTQPGNTIHAVGQTWISGHDSNVILESINNGYSWTTIETSTGVAGPEVGANITAIWAISPSQWYAATNTGKLWYTSNRGYTWTQRQLPDQDNLQTIFDIKFSAVSSQVGALAVRTNARGYVYRTLDGGRTWFNEQPAIQGLANNDHVTTVALAGVNVIGAGGLKTGSTDGFLAIAENTGV